MDVEKWAVIAAFERLAGMFITTVRGVDRDPIDRSKFLGLHPTTAQPAASTQTRHSHTRTQGITAYFYLRTCWTILVRFKARERVKKRHENIVRKFIVIMNIVIVTNALWTAYLYLYVPRPKPLMGPTPSQPGGLIDLQSQINLSLQPNPHQHPATGGTTGRSPASSTASSSWCPSSQSPCTTASSSATSSRAGGSPAGRAGRATRRRWRPGMTTSPRSPRRWGAGAGRRAGT